MAKHNLIGLKEFRINLDKYAKNIEKGASYTVLRRSKPLFRVAPVDENELGWETIFDADRDNKGNGIAGTEVLRILRKINKDERARKVVSKAKRKA